MDAAIYALFNWAKEKDVLHPLWEFPLEENVLKVFIVIMKL
nr:hypothetical protein [Acinetobacter baumannii]